MALRNALLSQLPTNEVEAVTPLLTQIWLPADTRLIAIEQRPEHVYFPGSAVISVITRGDNGRNCCVGLYGYEGFGSTCALFGIPMSPAEEIVQSAGWSYCLSTNDLQGQFAILPGLRRRLHWYVHVFMMQISYTAFALASTRIEQRLARWLLMYQDRTSTSSLAITHQRLSDMLGVRRAGVTEAIHVLEGERLLRGHRGLIDILDRPRLIALTAGAYGAPEAEYVRMLQQKG